MMIEHGKEADSSNSSIKFSHNSATSSDSNGCNTRSRCANYLPHELTIKVLSRLPDRALVRFKCLSKSWHNIISNSLLPSPVAMSGLLLILANKKFIDLLRPGCSTSTLLEALQSRWASLRTSNPMITVTHHCNGLFLLSDDDESFQSGTSFYVCNPATNQYVALPEPPPFPVRVANCSALVYDPRESSHYKVLRIGCRGDQVEGQIFSSDKNQWISFSACGHHHIVGDRLRLIYLNGAMHFLCFLGLCVISFYVEEKLFREFKVPSSRAVPIVGKYLGESNGRLLYTVCYLDKLQIWMLQSFDTNKWFKNHTLHIAYLGKAISPSVCFLSITVMAFHRNLQGLFIRHRGVIFSYYFGSGMKDIDRLKEACIIGEDAFVDFVSPYSRCLVSLKDTCDRSPEKFMNAVGIDVCTSVIRKKKKKCMHLSSHPLT